MIDKLDLYTKAQSLRQKLGVDLNSPIDIFSLVLTIPYLTLVLMPMGDRISGMCLKNQGFPIIAINSAMTLGRQRFSLAHELYHLYYDENEHSTVCTKTIGNGTAIEKAADQFATYFLIPPMALDRIVERLIEVSKSQLSLKDVVVIEQTFGVSRHAILYRLLSDRKIKESDVERFKDGAINSAMCFGYDESLYQPSPAHRQYKTYGYYIQAAETLDERDLVSTGKLEQLLLSAFRADLVYGEELATGKIND